jgi:hypothetical protein
VKRPEDFSFDTYDAAISFILTRLQPRSVLDVGAGAGKYGSFARQVAPGVHLTAVQPSSLPVADHPLTGLYDTILPVEATSLIETHSSGNWEVAILGDVIEHFKKSDGLDFLNWLVYRTKYILIVTPEAMRMYGDPWYEGHNSVWSVRDFGWHNNWAWTRFLQMQFFVLRGYLPCQTTLRQVCADIDAAGLRPKLQGYEGLLRMTLQDQLDVTDVLETASGKIMPVFWQQR